MAVEWTITIEGRNDFGDTCRKEVRIDKSWESLFDGDIGLSIDDGKKIMSTLQSAVVNHEAETYSLSRRVCPDGPPSRRSKMNSRRYPKRSCNPNTMPSIRVVSITRSE